MMAAHRKDFTKAVELYAEGYSIAEVAGCFGMSRQAMWDILMRRGVEMRKLAPRPVIVWNGRRFTLRDTGYYGETSGKRQLLHRAMWISEKGPIPHGYEIHHKDENKENNVIHNFELLTCSEHAKEHGFRGNQYVKRPRISVSP